MKIGRLSLHAMMAVLLGACATMPDDAFRLSESALEMREIQTRSYSDVSDVEILSASSAVYSGTSGYFPCRPSFL